MAISDNQREREKLIVINFARLFFAGLIIFELLNYLKILQFSLEYTWLGLVVTAVVSLIILEVTARYYRRKKGHRPHWLVWLIAAAGLSLDAAGDFFHLYGKYDWWDRFVHLFNSAVVCFALFIVFNAFWIGQFKFSLLFKEGKMKLSLFLAAASTLSLSALYEIEEYTEDIIFHTKRLGPGADTADDLFFNFTGALLVVFFITVYYFATRKRDILE